MANKHFIGRQIFELRVQSSEGVYDLQQQVGNLFRGHLVPAMEKLFDRIAGDEVIRIDRVELNLGKIDVKEIRAEEFVRQIITLLEKECLSHQRLSLRGDSEADERDGTSVRKPLSTHVFDLWLHWLEKGSLPPYALQPEENWMDEVLKTLGVDFHAVTRLRDMLKRSSSAVRRLVLQHKAVDLKSITELYTGHTQTELLRLFDELKGVFHRRKVSSAIPYRQLETEMWMLVIHRVILERKKLDSRSLGVEMIKHPALIGMARQLVKETEADSAEFPMLQELFRSGITELREARRSDPGSVHKSEAATLQEDRGLETPQFFTNAGVVLLHPFLSRFFRELNLLEDSGFRDTESRSRAVLLLHYMASGREQVPDYEMVLLKFLCDMPVNLPLDHTIRLTKEEKKEAGSVLQAAIDHWEALGSTTPDGLREGFLMREGKLEKDRSGWKLHVEQKTIDVLLDRLPWTVSIIKLPWMKEMLKVEWR